MPPRTFWDSREQVKSVSVLSHVQVGNKAVRGRFPARECRRREWGKRGSQAQKPCFIQARKMSWNPGWLLRNLFT